MPACTKRRLRSPQRSLQKRQAGQAATLDIRARLTAAWAAAGAAWVSLPPPSAVSVARSAHISASRIQAEEVKATCNVHST